MWFRGERERDRKIKRLGEEEEDKGGEEGSVDSIQPFTKHIFIDQFLYGRHCSRYFGHSHDQVQWIKSMHHLIRIPPLDGPVVVVEREVHGKANK